MEQASLLHPKSTHEYGRTGFSKVIIHGIYPDGKPLIIKKSSFLELFFTKE